MIEGNVTLGGERTMRYLHDVFQNCIPEMYMMLSTHVTPINLINIGVFLLLRMFVYVEQEIGSFDA